MFKTGVTRIYSSHKYQLDFHYLLEIKCNYTGTAQTHYHGEISVSSHDRSQQGTFPVSPCNDKLPAGIH